MAAFCCSFGSVMLLVLKDGGWHHYLLPAFAALPLVVVGVALACRNPLGRSVRWLPAAALVLFASTQFSQTTSFWRNRAGLEDTPAYLAAQANRDALADCLSERWDSNHQRPIRILHQWGEVVPRKAAGREVIGLDVYRPDLAEMLSGFQADWILLTDNHPWLSPPDNRASASTIADKHDRSRRLLEQSRKQTVQIDQWRITTEEIDAGLDGKRLFRVRWHDTATAAVYVSSRR
jgi:hypothetical protein